MKQLFLIIALSNATSTIGCRIGGGGAAGGGTSGARATLEPMVTNAITYSANIAETQHINKTMAYRALKVNPSIMNGSSVLSSFYITAQTNNLHKMVSVEESLQADSLISATTKITGVTASNAIETNYKTFYNVYVKTKGNAYTSTDSLSLLGIANMCPYTDGAVVYQARALYNSIYDGYYKFTNTCATANSSRLLQNTVGSNDENTNNVNVILKSKIYPNPNTGVFNIEIVDKTTTHIEVSIFDVTGKQIIKENKTVNNSIINLDYDFLNGIYLIKLKLKDGSVDVHRLVITK